MKIGERTGIKCRNFVCRIWKMSNSNIAKANTTIYGIPKVIWRDRIEMGNYCSINEKCFFHCAGGIRVGEGVVFSHGTSLISEGLNPTQFLNGSYIHAPKPIVVGNRVWIGANSTVLGGVKIADNVIIGAGSVVTKDCLQEFGLYAGVPAKLIKKFDREEINESSN